MDGVEKNNASAKEQIAVIYGVQVRGTRDDDMLSEIVTSINTPHTTATNAGHTSTSEEEK